MANDGERWRTHSFENHSQTNETETETRNAGPTPKGWVGVSADQPRWRWDLNPRWTFTHTRFRGVLLWPLGHATVGEITRAGAPQRNRAGSVSTPARGFRRSPRPDAWPDGRVRRPTPTHMRRTSGPKPPAPDARSAPASAPLRT